MGQSLAVSHSIISAEGLSRLIEQQYGLPAPVSCQLLAPGINDTYQVASGGAAYVYRVYRAAWRSIQDIQYELQLLLHLQRSGIPVSAPIPRADGALSSELESPEGQRTGVLFSYAPGRVLGYQPDGALKYGALAARLHNSLDLFRSDTPRFVLDLEHLLEGPLRKIRPFAEVQGSWQFICRLAERLRFDLQSQVSVLDWGVCHGDLHGHNVHTDALGQLVLFDFDCGGPGWRAYDLAVYRWAVDLHAKSREPWDAFLAGYSGERTVSPIDLSVIPSFVAIRTIWLLGLQVDQITLRGVKHVETFIEGGAKALQKWDPALLR